MPATQEQRIAFRENTRDVFVSIENEFGINAKIPLVQSALESNWGLSELAVKDANIFGMTPGWQWLKAMRQEIPLDQVEHWSKLGSSTCFYLTTEHHSMPPNKIRYWDFPGDIEEKRDDGKGGSILTVRRYFRKYDNWGESSWDWARKIAKEPRYRFAYDASKVGDIVSFAAAIQAAGYATDASYGDKIIQYGRAVASLVGVA